MKHGGLRYTRAMNAEIASLCAGIDQALSALPGDVPPLHTVVLFGSLARGRARAGSDADVAVQADRPLTAKQRMRIIESLTLLLDRILAEGIRVRGSDRHWGDLVFRNVMDREDFVPLQQRILASRRSEWLSK